jgi:predicted O-methyltransferase YrrM
MVISRLRRHPDSTVRNLGTAIDSAHRNRLSIDEQRWIGAVESLRTRLLNSTEQVPVVDYGAGFPSDNRSEEQMLAGVDTVEVVGEACREYSKSSLWTGLLFRLVRTFRPAVGIELGTCLGVSAAAHGAALELNGAGRLITLEGSPAFARIAADGVSSLGLGHRIRVVEGRFQETLQGVLDDAGTVDYGFIDGHHDGPATLRYFEQFLPHLASRSLLVFDDISNYASMREAWQQICAHPRVDVVVDASVVGICLLGAGVKLRAKVTLE